MKQLQRRRNRLAAERLEARNLLTADFLISANFDSGNDGFTYQDDTFRGTNQPSYASGSRLANGGQSGGGLRVLLGGIDAADIFNMSGGWQTTFTVTDANKPVTVSFQYNLTQDANYESNELSQMLLSVDGVLYGEGNNDYVAQIVGNGNGGAAQSTGWQSFSVTLGTMSTGSHSLIIGGFNNQKTFNDESTDARIDNVSVTASDDSIIQVRHFDTWNGGIIPSTDVAGLTYHPPSGHFFLADSEINELPQQFTGNNIFETSTSGNQLFGQYASGNSEPTGIAYSEFDGFFYVVNDDAHTLQRYNASLNSPLVTIDVASDVPSAQDPEGITVDPVTGTLYLVDGSNGGIQVLVYSSNLTYQYRFSVAAQMSDAEGIAFDPVSRNLFLVSDPDLAIFEYTTSGAFAGSFDISDFQPFPRTPQGLTFAPTSNPNDDPAALAIYIADAGVDNFPDGRVYEALISTGPPSTNLPPSVNAGGDQLLFLPDVAQLDGTVADDGQPSPPGSVATQWTLTSGPAPVVFGNPTAVDTTATFSTSGRYVLRLTADDGDLAVFDEVTIDVNTIEVRITDSRDDVEETATGSVKFTSSDLELVLDGNGNQTVGLRFPSVVVPQGATIQNAYIQFQADEKNSEPTSLSIQGEDTDDAAVFISTDSNVSSRNRTSASVNWSPAAWTQNGQAGLDQRTPNLAAVVSEIVNRPGWIPGNALAFVVSGTGERVAESVDGDPSGAPLLHIEFTQGNVGNLAPILDPIGSQIGNQGNLISFTASAIDPNVPTDNLTFSLAPGAPAGAQIDPNTGIFTWTPTAQQGPGDFFITVRVTDDGSPSLSDSETITISVNASGVPTTVEVRVSASKDDAEERADGDVVLTSADLEMAFDAGGNQTVGLRFASVSLPAGATITSAYVQFQADETDNGATNLIIRGEDADNPVTFSNADFGISSRPTTSAFTSWAPAAWNTVGEAGAAQRTSDLANVIQEIVDRPGWADGNALVLLISGTGERVAESYNGDQAGAPLLHIEYLTGGSSAPASAPLRASELSKENVVSISNVPLALDLAGSFLPIDQETSPAPEFLWDEQPTVVGSSASNVEGMTKSELLSSIAAADDSSRFLAPKDGTDNQTGNEADWQRNTDDLFALLGDSLLEDAVE